MPSSRQARMIRTAISPRLAMSRRRKGGPWLSLRKDESVPAVSEWDVAMLLSGVRIPLGLEHGEGSDHLRSRFGRANDVVDVAARRGDIWVRELGLVFLHQATSFRGRIFGRCQLVLVDDVDGPLRAHDRDLGA